uniref:(California timema) hypothetical protein n=1 Tax=Timema californicum TaxID=61474 RepID=A0A7R9JEQ1_TIMCA|nr:unnamed protein product [Timema californicum]
MILLLCNSIWLSQQEQVRAREQPIINPGPDCDLDKVGKICNSLGPVLPKQVMGIPTQQRYHEIIQNRVEPHRFSKLLRFTLCFSTSVHARKYCGQRFTTKQKKSEVERGHDCQISVCLSNPQDCQHNLCKLANPQDCQHNFCGLANLSGYQHSPCELAKPHGCRHKL